MGRRSLPTVAATTVVLGTLLAAGAALAQDTTTAPTASTFTATAGGELMRGVVRFVPPILQEDIVDPGAVAANARLTSYGESQAYASNPYPGSFPVSLPGLLSGVIGTSKEIPQAVAGALQIPGYPLIATSDHPTRPTSTVQAGTMTLRAESRERHSRGWARDGGNVTEADVDAGDDGTVTARAASEVATVDSGPSLRMSGIRSAATVTRSPGGEVERETEFSVAAISVLGRQLRLTRDGLELADLNLPAGDASAAVDGLLASLQEQGTTVRFTGAVETPDGVISPGVEIERSFDTGVNGIVGTVITSYGRAFASVSNVARPGVAGTVPGDGGLGAAAGGALSPGGDAAGAVGGDPAPLDAPAASPAPGAPGRGGGGTVGEVQPVTALRPERTDAGRFYPAIVGAGAVLAIALSLFRKLGMEFAWSS